VQCAIRRCSSVLWRRCSIRRRTHTGNFVFHEPMKIISSDGRAGRGGSTTHEVINRPPQLVRFLAAHFLCPEGFTLPAPQVSIDAPFSYPERVCSCGVSRSGRPSSTLKTTNSTLGVAAFSVEPWVRRTTTTSYRAWRQNVVEYRRDGVVVELCGSLNRCT